MEDWVRGSVGTLLGIPPEDTSYVITGTLVFVGLVAFSFITTNKNKSLSNDDTQQPIVQPKTAVATATTITTKKARTNKKKKKARALPVVAAPPAPPVVEAPPATTTKKTNKKKKKAAAVVAPPPPPVVEEVPKEPEPPVVVEEKKVEPLPPAPAVVASKKSKKKKKNKAKAVAPPPPVPKVEEEPVVTTDDDEDDAALLAFAHANRTNGSKSKKSKKPIEQEEEGEWSTVPTKSTQRKAAASSSSSETTITLSLAGPEEMFLVLGPQGTTIQQIQSTTGAQITLDKKSNIVYIAGQNAQDAASHIRAILADHTVKTLAYTTPNAVKAILGKSGLQIQNIQTTTGCQLHANLQAQTVTITGPSVEAVAAAEALCQKAVYGETQASIDLKCRAMVLAVCGTNFTQLQAWQKETNTRLEMGKDGNHTMTIRGDTGPVQQAQRLVQERVKLCQGITVPIPKSSHVGTLIGPGGTTLRKIQDQSGAFLEIGNQECHIMGEPTSVETAQGLVNKCLQGHVIDLKPGHIQVTMELGVAAFAVIGRGGSTIAELEQTHNVKVNVQESVCSIVGLKQKVPAAQAAITALIAPILEKEAIMEKLRQEAAQQNGHHDMWAGQSPEEDDAEGW